ncbi:TIGR01906 family membrane protein [Candidatus Woesearchaeota archaeon]|nr:TIGR01906 family membrane protein [Candidatus Woesearchaeota archaeon]
MNSSIHKTAKILLTISLILLILITPLLFFSYNEEHYNSQAQKNDVYQKLGENLTKEQNKNTINYLLGKEKLKGKYTENEIKHMKDVKKIYTTINIISLTCLLIIILSIIYFTKNKQEKQIIRSLKISSITIIIMGLLLIALTLFNFQSTFTIFHNIFFPQGNWLFPYNSLLITLYPNKFFINTANYSFLASTIISLIILGFTFLSKAHYLFFLKK